MNRNPKIKKIVRIVILIALALAVRHLYIVMKNPDPILRLMKDKTGYYIEERFVSYDKLGRCAVGPEGILYLSDLKKYVLWMWRNGETLGKFSQVNGEQPIYMKIVGSKIVEDPTRQLIVSGHLKISPPIAMAFDRQGNIYSASGSNLCVFRMTTDTLAVWTRVIKMSFPKSAEMAVLESGAILVSFPMKQSGGTFLLHKLDPDSRKIISAIESEDQYDNDAPLSICQYESTVYVADPSAMELMIFDDNLNLEKEVILKPMGKSLKAKDLGLKFVKLYAWDKGLVVYYKRTSEGKTKYVADLLDRKGDPVKTGISTNAMLAGFDDLGYAYFTLHTNDIGLSLSTADWSSADSVKIYRGKFKMN
ncbi:hypothetical protein ACFLU6_06085 [Acidobacteriota bacterium]